MFQNNNTSQNTGSKLNTPSPCRGGAPLNTAGMAEKPPEWLTLFDDRAATIIDVRPILMDGREPIADVLAAAERLLHGSGLIIVAPFNPMPLRSLLHERGLATYGHQLGDHHWCIRVTHKVITPTLLPEGRATPIKARASAGSSLKLGGAVQRLLPELIPLRFFGVALFAHAATWIGVFIFAETLPWFHGGLGPALGIIHLAVLGVLLITAMGASFQMLPVALALPPPKQWICNLVFMLLVAGGVGLISGFSLSNSSAVTGGALLLFTAIVFYAVTLMKLVSQSNDNSLLRQHITTALIAVIGAVALAVILALDLKFGWIENHQDMALCHFILIGFGFMGMFVLGFSQILIPMFLVAEPAGKRVAQTAFALAVIATIGSIAGTLTNNSVLLIAGVITGCLAALCHIYQMMLTLRGRLRARLGQEFILIRLAWLLCPLSFGIALLIIFGIGPDTLPSVFGFTLIFGWYLTFLLGVLQRILPFLASMHATRLGAKSLSPTKLVSSELLTTHQWCHLIALALVGSGLVLANIWLIRLGAISGFIGAISFILFGFCVLKRTRDQLVVKLN